MSGIVDAEKVGINIQRTATVSEKHAKVLWECRTISKQFLDLKIDNRDLVTVCIGFMLGLGFSTEDAVRIAREDLHL